MSSANTLIAGGVGLILGFVGGNFAGAPGSKTSFASKVEESVSGELADAKASVAAIEGQMTDMQAQVTALTDRLGSMETAIQSNAAKTADATDGLKSEIAGLPSMISDQIDAAQSAQTETLTAMVQSNIADMQSNLAAAAATTAMAAIPATTSEAEPEPSTQTEETTASEEADDMPVPVGTPIGRTLYLDDDRIRVYVSAISDDNQVARIAVNGVDTHDVRIRRSVAFELEGKDCEVTVVGIDRGHVDLSHACTE
jgi:uncharacterized coiled-coil protein SlyX